MSPLPQLFCVVPMAMVGIQSLVGQTLAVASSQTAYHARPTAYVGFISDPSFLPVYLSALLASWQVVQFVNDPLAVQILYKSCS